MSAGFVQSNLVSDVPGIALATDPNLLNPWGIVAGPAGPLWVSENQAGISTPFSGLGPNSPDGSAFRVLLPSVAGPTGALFNAGNDFIISANGRTAPSEFLFATGDGTILGWNAVVDPTHAILAVDHSLSSGTRTGADYTGLAIGTNARGTFLFAANFGAGTIDVYNQSFQNTALAGAFVDLSLPAGFAPFNIANLGGELYVTYAKQDAATHEDIPGAGNGYIAVFDTSGNLLRRLVRQGPLNSPWGLAIAPGGFGSFSNDLLVGNFRDGRINAFDPHNGTFLGPVTDAAGNPTVIPGLWGLQFGNGAGAGGTNTLFFTANLGSDRHGLLGKLETAAGFTGQTGSVTGIIAKNYQDFLAKTLAEQGDAYPLPPATGPAFHDEDRSGSPPVALLPTLSQSKLAGAAALLSGTGDLMALTGTAPGATVLTTLSNASVPAHAALQLTALTTASSGASLARSAGDLLQAPQDRSEGLALLWSLSTRLDSTENLVAIANQSPALEFLQGDASATLASDDLILSLIPDGDESPATDNGFEGSLVQVSKRADLTRYLVAVLFASGIQLAWSFGRGKGTARTIDRRLRADPLPR